MLVILEGVDLSGKTTLARSLEKLGFEYRHAGPPKDHPLVEYVKSLQDYDPARDNVVLDRFHVGERVWPSIFGRPTLYTSEMHLYVELFLRSRGAVLIACDASLYDLKQRHKLRGEDAIEESQLAEVQDAFQRQFWTSILPTLRYEVKLLDLESIVEFANHNQRQAIQSLGPTSEYVGPPRADVLLVGDRIGPGDKTQLALPFAPYPSTSGAYLLSCFVEHASGQELQSLAITNANARGADDAAHVFDLTGTLDCPNVVALGNEAARALEFLGMSFGIAPHPQWVRRFKHDQKERYYQSIVEAAWTKRDLRKEWRDAPSTA